MSERIHDDEYDTGETTVRALLRAQCPRWAGAPVTYLRTSGTDNAMWRVRIPDGADVVVRLPRNVGAAAACRREVDVLGAIADGPLAAVVDTPRVRHVGEPDDAFPHRWAVLGWLDGVDAWSARHELDGGPDGGPDELALDLARAVRAIRGSVDVPAPRRAPGGRGGPLDALLDGVDRWLDDPRWDAPRLLDVAAVRRSAAESREVAGEPVVVGFVHGDLIPGNLLTAGRRLTAIIDWGTAAHADLAQDLAPAWAVFDEPSRSVFREALGVDDAAWLRGRAFELQHAVAGILYYAPRRHPLADVMARTLRRILDDG